MKLWKAIEKGDLNTVKDRISHNPGTKNMRNPNSGMTTLHYAIYAGRAEIAEELMKDMSAEDLERQDCSGATFLHIVALTGATEIAESLVKRHDGLLGFANSQGHIPVVTACVSDQTATAIFLYDVTSASFSFPEIILHGTNLLHYAILSKNFGIALDLVQSFPTLAIAPSSPLPSTVVNLSYMPSAFNSSSQLSFCQRLIYKVMPVPDIKSDIPGGFISLNSYGLKQMTRLVLCFFKFKAIRQIYDMKLIHAQAVALLRRICRQLSSLDSEELEERGIHIAISEAIRQGIREIIVEMTKAYPELIMSQYTYSTYIFRYAIKYRQENIFNLTDKLDARKSSTFADVDSLGNNVLHLAAQLAPFPRLSRISGAALQMQRELQWYKEVETLSSPILKEMRNCDGEKPHQVFTRSHKELLMEGEKWMKKTATSFTIASALIVTIMFAAAFTVPGGNKQESGLPNFLHEKSFRIFVISDAVALYAEEDFLTSLPTKLIVALSTLFLSIVAMMVSFCAALMIIMDGQLLLVIPIFLLAGIPVTLFILLQFPLLCEILVATSISIFR
ncbi:uncharacterized protein LOC120012280 isoform X1 [Tripterygium wilfordii]|uniref:uncharacterized protein LOC120012280 isoform X1 n=1 Tax=Tripterygium wilfordii TaxID=458696 RepID=UPI0018F7ED36|nr:uncharacterized protein LOC120012280 isoform X1 [Tripterygium wilfordii]XP_038719553.1 uncharacterized protein LOC120012280 isoform X1 [Tripterygium wilfordii]